MVVAPVAKSRPGRAAAKNRKPIVDTVSDEDEDEDVGDHGLNDTE